MKNKFVYSDAIFNFMIKNNFNYIDFIAGGSAKVYAQMMNFFSKEYDDIIPYYFSPFKRRNIKIDIAFKLKRDVEFSIFAGDGDLDRPN